MSVKNSMVEGYGDYYQWYGIDLFGDLSDGFSYLKKKKKVISLPK